MPPNLNFRNPITQLPWGIFHSPLFSYLSLAAILNFVLQVELPNGSQQLRAVKLKSFHSAIHYLLKQKDFTGNVELSA